jgi:hypothetical protein
MHLVRLAEIMIGSLLHRAELTCPALFNIVSGLCQRLMHQMSDSALAK